MLESTRVVLFSLGALFWSVTNRGSEGLSERRCLGALLVGIWEMGEWNSLC